MILTSLFIILGFNFHVNADRAEQGALGGAFGGMAIGGMAGGGKGALWGGLAGAGLGYAIGRDADRRAERRYSREYVYQAPPAYADYDDEDVVYVPVRRQRYIRQSYPRARRVFAPRTQQQIIYRD